MPKSIRVLDLSRVTAGPYRAALLGNFGGDVVDRTGSEAA